MKHRPLRVGELIRDELSGIFLRHVEFNGALVTITEVEVTDKLDSARVRVSVLPSDRAQAILNQLRANRGELQHMLNQKLNIKPMPRILFEIDRGPENAAKVEKTILDN